MWQRIGSSILILLPLAFGAQFPFSATLLKDSFDQPIYALQWSFDVVHQTITFNVLGKTTGWVGFGLSRDGGMIGSDVVTGWVNSTGAYLQDRYADAHALPSIDEHQDWLLLSGNEANGWTNLTFTRKWVTGDSRDRDVLAGTARVIFSSGVLDPVTLVPQYHGPTYRGAVSLNLLGGLINKPTLPLDAQNLTLTIKNVKIPAVSTTYWCAGYKLPDAFSQKRYIVQNVFFQQYSPLITSTFNNTLYVHHILLYLCPSLNETTDLEAGFECNWDATPTLQSCRTGQVIAGWAVGGETFTYPEGISFGLGGPGEKYVMLEVHYNNPERNANVTDSSGFHLLYTNNVPTHEAGIITLGVKTSPFLIIPPKTSAFNVRGWCISDCTSSNIPPTGITIFANLLHTHRAGIEITLRHLRWNSTCGAYQELPPIDQNLQYDFNFQQFMILLHNVTVFPGDLLEVDCIYNTMNLNNVTLGGKATTDEMCLSFPVYYPRNGFTSCLSTTNIEAYTAFVHSNLSPQSAVRLKNLSASHSKHLSDDIRSIYRPLRWNQAQIHSLQDVTINSYIEAFCNKSDGTFTHQTLLKTPSLSCLPQASSAVRSLVKKAGLAFFVLLALMSFG